MTTTTTVQCHSCFKTFKDFNELALHIMSEKHNHKKGKMWAAKYIAGNTLRTQLEFKKYSVDPDYVPTEFGEDNRANRSVRLSGETEYASCICPKCHNNHRPLLPVEYLELDYLWRISGKLAVFCESCKR